MKTPSLKTQCIAGICGLILFVSLALLLYVRMQFHNRLEQELQKRGASIARNLADGAAKLIITENHVALQLLINSVKRSEEDIRYIYVVNHQQQVVAHTFGQAFPRDLLKFDRPNMGSVKPFVQLLRYEQDVLDDITAGIQHGDFGRVHVGITDEFVKTEKRETIHRNAPFIGLILLVGGIGAWLFALKITRPIIALSKSVKNITAGRLDGVPSIDSSDEIGELTSAFNAMTAELKRRIELQHQTEEELRMQASLLEDEAAERQMAQEELSVKQCQLEALNQSLEERINGALTELRKKDRIMLAQGRQAAMGEMINNIAHQWRQPLNNLGLIVQGMEVEYESGMLTREALACDVENAMNAIMFMSQTISDFSTFFSPDSVKKVFEVSHSLTKVIAMIDAGLSKQRIKIIIEKQEDGIAVEGYFNEYSQVLLNILNNAKDVLAERKVAQPVIKISITRTDTEAVVQISDNAGGIPGDIIEHIFDPYFSTKEHGKGSGIGLYMSRNIVEEHFEGTLTAANIDGSASFTIITPLARGDQAFIPLKESA